MFCAIQICLLQEIRQSEASQGILLCEKGQWETTADSELCCSIILPSPKQKKNPFFSFLRTSGAFLWLQWIVSHLHVTIHHLESNEIVFLSVALYYSNPWKPPLFNRVPFDFPQSH